MNYNYKKPFDNRLQVLIKNEQGEGVITPVSGGVSSNAFSYLMTLETMSEKKEEYDKAGKLNVYNKIIKKQKELIKEAQGKKENKLQTSIMNPYAMLHLTNGINDSFETTLIDKSDKSPWYEMSDKNNNIGYSKIPTTSTIIEWGKHDEKSRTPYLFQDFVFCKWWNKIPNNRLITLRRYSNPVLDNLNTPADGVVNEDGTYDDLKTFPPMATAITYFGEETGNNLKDILKFTTAYNWGETKADIWDLSYSTGKEPSSNEQMSGALGSIGLQYGNQLAKVMNFTSVWSGDFNKVGFEEGKTGVPPDPYKDGPYSNRIQGPINRIDTVKKREAGIKFEMSGLKIKFSYVARPIGGINSKAIMLDILSNFMVMGSTTAVFFGGAHRNRIPGRRFPASKNNAIKQLYKGNVLGKDGAIAAFGNNITNFADKNGGFTGILSTMWDAAKGILGDLLNSLGNPLGLSTGSKTKKGNDVSKNLQSMVSEKMKTGMAIPYVQNMRALLTGEPVGEWHLTIGNPMNPIAMIGNLICTGVEVEFDEDAGLGPDDFPLGWDITVSLDHGMIRDRDMIESMFNLGNGRIYELDDNFLGSADYVTGVDDKTKDKSQGDAPAGKEYITTKTSTLGTVLQPPKTNTQDNNKTITMDINNINAVGFEDGKSITSRLPKISITNLNAKKLGK